MKTSTLFPMLFSAAMLIHVAASAAEIDMDDPRRAVGREDGVRVDAQLRLDIVSPGVPIGVDYQIQNFTKAPIAIADKVSSASYDADSLTITLSVGSEVPQEHMPRVVLIAPGEKRMFRTSAMPQLSAGSTREEFKTVPRFVQVKVSILRELAPFRKLIDDQARGPQRISDQLFDKWFECNDTILLNSVPVRFSAGTRNSWSAENRSAAGSF